MRTAVAWKCRAYRLVELGEQGGRLAQEAGRLGEAVKLLALAMVHTEKR